MSKNPNCIALIMDGNRRWANKRSMPSIAGHKAGVKALKRVIISCAERRINNLVFFAFSTENWSRPPLEVDGLLKLLERFLKSEIVELNKENIKIKFIGDKNSFSEKISNLLIYSEKLTEDNNGLKLFICINYGGKQDICHSITSIAKKIKNNTINISEINEKLIKDNLLSFSVPDIDLLIRTSGEKRISNFMIWQLLYSEMYFTETLWPDFSEIDLQKALDFYEIRNRTFGASKHKKIL